MKQQEIKLQINAPDGFRAENVRIENGAICFEIAEDKGFKDGDVLVAEGADYEAIVIFKEPTHKDTCAYYICYNLLGDSLRVDRNLYRVKFRHATEKEKQLLFDKITERNIYWDAEKKILLKRYEKPQTPILEDIITKAISECVKAVRVAFEEHK